METEGHEPGIDRDRGFTAFVCAESPRLLRLAYVLTSDSGHAEDVLQIALARVYVRWHQAETHPRAYASKVVVNLARDRWRRLRRRPRETVLSTAYALADDDDVVRTVERLDLVEAIRALPRRQREIVALRYLEDLSVADTARVLGVSEGTVTSSLARAITSLRTFMTETRRTDCAT